MWCSSCPLFVLERMVPVVTSLLIVPCFPFLLSGAISSVRRPMLCLNEGVVGEGPRVAMCLIFLIYKRK